MYARNAPHRCLHHLRIVGVGRVEAAVDGANAKPVGNADDGTEIAGILHAVERQSQFVVGRAGVGQRRLKHRQHLLRVLQETQFPQFVVAHLRQRSPSLCRSVGRLLADPFTRGKHLAGGSHGQQVAHHLRTFGHEDALLPTVFLLLQRAYVFQFRFADHRLQRY